MDRHSDMRLKALVDTASGSCRNRRQFWADMSARGVNYAVTRLAQSPDAVLPWIDQLIDRLRELGEYHNV